MRDTPLCQLEQQMMTPPNFKARGHGRYSPGFQYSSEDTECPYCINFRRNQPCPLKLCICLDERIAAGALNLNEFVRDCFFPEAGVQLLARLERNFTCCSIRCTCLGDGEHTRWNRSDFIGVLQENLLPEWAEEKLNELTGQNVDHSMEGMKME